MLKIFYGRESIDKERFIYKEIGESGKRTLVIVPDQYTLEAEKRAFDVLGAEALMDIEIISLSRLGFKVLTETGGGRQTFIDKYGRHMLLSSIAAEYDDKLQVFRGSLRKTSFIEMANNFISEMKQYDVSPEDLAEMGRGVEQGCLLQRKLSDLQLIFSAYEERIKGKYTDAEDYIDLYMSKIPESSLIRESDIWVYGFDSFAPKSESVLGQLMVSAANVNVFLTGDRDCGDQDLFLLTEIVMENLEKRAASLGVSSSRRQIDSGFDTPGKSPAVSFLERELFSVAGRRSDENRGITVVKAANMYSEAESAASFILHLLRDCGLRYRDIVIICNDQEVRGSVIGRVFEEYEIPLFDDRKRSIMNSPIAVFVLALLETAVGGYRTSDIFRTLKTGFSGLSDEETEALENYGIKYRIRGNMWKSAFVRGGMEYGEDGLAELEALRQKAMELFLPVEKLCRESGSVGDFLGGYYDYLTEQTGLADSILSLADRQQEQGFLDLAEETVQIWNKIVDLFDQAEELAGEEKFVGEDFILLISAGMEQMEVGVLPPTSDDILMGTMQRTRSGQVRAMVVIGANEGLLPADGTEEGLFTVDELDFLAEKGRQLCKVDRIRVMEEKLAIYRNLSKPTDYLWISYSASDEEGREIRPSEIIELLHRTFPSLQEEKDVLNEGNMDKFIGGRTNTLRHLTHALQQAEKGETIDSRWKAVVSWYRTNYSEDLDRVFRGLAFTNEQKPLPEKLTRLLYRRDSGEQLVLSPSRLERFSRCPFAHYIAYGLHPDERRIFEAAGREIGDLYHRCLMEVSEKLNRENAWETVTPEECRNYVSLIIQREAAVYREGVFQFGGEERYKVRRIEDTCFQVCWALVEQIRAGKIKESRYEVPFGKNCEIPPVEVNIGGENVSIEGKIDRLDILEEDRVKIIDYKTGKENFNIYEARGGYRLQLMLYLKAAQEGSRKPAGVFYFLIRDPRVELNGAEEKISEKISKEMRKSFRLNGIMVDDCRVIRDIAGEFQGFSDIVPLRSGKDGVKGTSDGFLLTEDEFSELQQAVDHQVKKLCEQLAKGRIAIAPKKTDRESACTYCSYRSICRFDPEFPGCSYEIIK